MNIDKTSFIIAFILLWILALVFLSLILSPASFDYSKEPPGVVESPAAVGPICSLQTFPTLAAGINNLSLSEVITAEVSAYCLSGQMANGFTVHRGAAACPRAIPFGTQIKIDDQFFVCEDRLAPDYDHRFDIWMDNCQDALNWGVKEKEVEIYE